MFMHTLFLADYHSGHQYGLYTEADAGKREAQATGLS